VRNLQPIPILGHIKYNLGGRSQIKCQSHNKDADAQNHPDNDGLTSDNSLLKNDSDVARTKESNRPKKKIPRQHPLLALCQSRANKQQTRTGQAFKNVSRQ
jgi:hypothetical protein